MSIVSQWSLGLKDREGGRRSPSLRPMQRHGIHENHGLVIDAGRRVSTCPNRQRQSPGLVDFVRLHWVGCAEVRRRKGTEESGRTTGYAFGVTYALMGPFAALVGDGPAESGSRNGDAYDRSENDPS
jgi:hypothetical protein